MARMRRMLVYAQCLDNSGAVEMFSYQASTAAFEDLSEQPRDKELLNLMDRLLVSDDFFCIGDTPLKVYWSWNGDCIVLTPSVELDASGRLSPVMFIFNAFTSQRKDFLRVTEKMHHVMHRSFDVAARKDFAKLQNFLNYPVLIVFLKMLLTR